MGRQQGQLPEVPHNVRLIKGLFSESLPKFLTVCSLGIAQG